ncbi:MAG TPA: 50S ribosomal protein L9 [Polyangia bacterium]|jgi:large subunit ribosomal protein L9|nr:50S ribosomal protein L9 [Polyangia bacterium]
MQVILREDVEHLGKGGELVTVRPGYGRNYLIPQGLAVLATEKNVARLEHEKRIISARNARLLKDAQAVAERLASIEVAIQRQAGEEDKIFGSVTTRDVEEALREKGLPIDRKKIVLAEPIRTLGVYTLDVKLTRDVVGKIKVWVVAKK